MISIIISFIVIIERPQTRDAYLDLLGFSKGTDPTEDELKKAYRPCQPNDKTHNDDDDDNDNSSLYQPVQ